MRMYKAPFKVVTVVNVYFEAKNQKDAERIIKENKRNIGWAIEDEKNILANDIRLNGCAYDPIEPCDTEELEDDNYGIEFHVDEIDE